MSNTCILYSCQLLQIHETFWATSVLKQPSKQNVVLNSSYKVTQCLCGEGRTHSKGEVL